MQAVSITWKGLPAASSRSPGFGDHVVRQKRGQNPRVDFVGLTRAFRDDPQSSGMGDHDPLRACLGEGRKPVVANRRFHHDLELTQRSQELWDVLHVRAEHPRPLQDHNLPVNLVDDAKRETLLVEVRTDEFHGEIPFVEGLDVKRSQPTVYLVFKDRHNRRAASLLRATAS